MDVFISYANEDRERAHKLANTLESQGLSVWWDRKIVTGKSFDQVIEHELDTAKSVVVLWSKASISSEWVKNEAGVGAERGVLVPALIDSVKIPLEFKRKQTADLVNWDGDASHNGFRELYQGVMNAIGNASTPLPSPITHDETRLRWNRRGVWIAAGIIIIGLGFGLYSAFSPIRQVTPIIQEAKVPNLIGLSRDQAADALKSEGLALGNIITRRTEEWIAGTVIDQKPERGKMIRPGSSVSLVLAQAPPPPEPALMIEIPNAVGMSVRAARANIEALGLQVVQRERNVTDSTKIGVVIEQHPMAGMSLKKGTTVELVIGTEPTVQKATVPNMVGLSMQKALDALRNVGLQLGRRDPETSPRPPGIILRQNIAAGEKVALGSEVNLVYASWPRVPNMVGLSMQEALDALRNAGLQLGRRNPQRSSRPPGTILRQSIAPRTEVVPGSTVNLVYASSERR